MTGGAIQLLQQATTAMERRQFGEAVALCEQVLARYGDEPNALMLLGHRSCGRSTRRRAESGGITADS